MRLKLSISPGAVLVLAGLYFFDEGGVLAVLLPAAVIHELGHSLALWFCSGGPVSVSATAAGFKMDYEYPLTDGQEILCALGGPLAGIITAIAASSAGNALSSEYLKCFAGVSLVLSAYNLLPAPPLDGYRILRGLAGDKAAIVIGIICAICTALAGLFALYAGFGAALLVSGIYLVLSSALK